jgi:hypothetical protein
MAALARSQLSVFADPTDERLLVEGPEVTLDTPAVEAVGMSLHELATNAMKHGGARARRRRRPPELAPRRLGRRPRAGNPPGRELARDRRGRPSAPALGTSC